MEVKSRSGPLTLARVMAISAMLTTALIATIAVSLVSGTASITFRDIFRVFTESSQVSEATRLIVLKIRLPRIFLAGLSGFTLSLGGLVFQALLRNPLADPFVLGVSSGAAFGAVIGIVMGFSFSLGVPVFSFFGAVITIYLVLAISRRGMGVESSTAILAGVIVNAFFTAVIMFFIATSSEDRLHSMLFWLYGDLSQSRISYSMIIAPAAGAGFVVLYSFAKHLDLMAAGEENAVHLGVNVERARFVCFVTVSLMVGLAVSFSGLIGFVGLIVPHLARMLFGSDNRLIMPVSALGGAVFLIAADTAARTVMSPSELPVGVITAFLGAPFFIYLLKTRGSRWTR